MWRVLVGSTDDETNGIPSNFRGAILAPLRTSDRASWKVSIPWKIARRHSHPRQTDNVHLPDRNLPCSEHSLYRDSEYRGASDQQVKILGPSVFLRFELCLCRYILRSRIRSIPNTRLPVPFDGWNAPRDG